MFVNAQAAPQPRCPGNPADTRAEFHDHPNSLRGWVRSQAPSN